MKPCVLRVATISFALSLCASTPGRAQPVCVGDEDVCGKWGDVKEWGFDTTHMILLESGDVLCVGPAGGTRVAVYHPAPDPEDETLIEIDPPKDSFDQPFPLHCAGHSQLADGRIVLMGGSQLTGYTFAHDLTVIFDPKAVATACTVGPDCDDFNGTCMMGPGLCDPWSLQDDMPTGKRWYLTCTTLADGRIVNTSDATRHSASQVTVPTMQHPSSGMYFRSSSVSSAGASEALALSQT